MRTLQILLVAVTVAAGVWATIAALQMGFWLRAHGVKVNWLWYRLTMPWYVHRYKEMTTASEGRPGPLYPMFLAAINLMAVFAIATVVAVLAGKT